MLCSERFAWIQRESSVWFSSCWVARIIEICVWRQPTIRLGFIHDVHKQHFPTNCYQLSRGTSKSKSYIIRTLVVSFLIVFVVLRIFISISWMSRSMIGRVHRHEYLDTIFTAFGNEFPCFLSFWLVLNMGTASSVPSSGDTSCIHV